MFNNNNNNINNNNNDNNNILIIQPLAVNPCESQNYWIFRRSVFFTIY